MKSISPALAARLASGTTTLALCWKLTRRDGVVLGFTDHDRDIAFDGVVYEATTGFTATEIETGLGLAVDNLDVDAALSSDRLDEHHLAAGLYDDATVEIWRVDWTDPTLRLLERRGSLGEIRRAGNSFAAEVRGLAHYLGQPQGRLYQYTCDAILGDHRCGLDVTGALYRASAVVSAATDGRTFDVTGLAGYADGWFTRGFVSVASGANAGVKSEIRRHRRVTGADRIELWQPLPHTPLTGDALLVTAGCDKTFATCRDRFGNAAAFRGFPHMPGNSFLSAVARTTDGQNDGRPLR
jgi:uncharacterized phage protein (TIGR02218 family)